MNRTFKPDAKTLVIALLLGIAPAVVGIVIAIVNPEGLIIAGAVLMILLSVIIILSTLSIKGKSITLDKNFISTDSPLLKRNMLWASVAEAKLRERENSKSRTDRYLSLTSIDQEFLTYNLSVLSLEDEQEVLQEIKSQLKRKGVDLNVKVLI